MHDESQRKWHQIVTLMLFMNDQHKRCFKFIKDCYSHEDLSHRDPKAIECEENKQASHLEETMICTKEKKPEEDQDMSWLWIILNKNIASRITTQGKKRNAK